MREVRGISFLAGEGRNQPVSERDLLSTRQLRRAFRFPKTDVHWALWLREARKPEQPIACFALAV